MKKYRWNYKKCLRNLGTLAVGLAWGALLAWITYMWIMTA